VHKREANEDHQILSKPQEAILVDWIGYQAIVAKPLNRDEIYSLVFDINGILLGLSWIYWFKKCHPKICTSWPGNLNLKHAQNFNPMNVTYFYKLLKDINDTCPNLPL
jgi:hypothetical protein